MFQKTLICIGNGYITSFWHSCWKEERSLKELFPLTFSSSKLKNASVASMGGWRDDVWEWGDLGIPFSMETEAAETDRQQLCFKLGSVCLRPEARDRVRWLAEPDDRLPTRDLLLARGIISPSFDSCCLCGLKRESMNHLLFKCTVSSVIWNKIASWIGLVDYKFKDIGNCFLVWHNFCKKQKVRAGTEGSLWLSVCWSIWKLRNEIILRNDGWSVSDIVWSVKELWWRWSFIGKITRTNYNFFEFTNDPFLYYS
ncbi:uncharacterized protein LOC131614573 [Vicia villosa]|uniref:uncharacterized protein LOC131614573 n=1 Tax=Vicia villosa TaxID=3911 RepID=UPI00273BB447|nr:uncharacterized protein LOC131614573 [Vicia villosa]